MKRELATLNRSPLSVVRASEQSSSHFTLAEQSGPNLVGKRKTAHGERYKSFQMKKGDLTVQGIIGLAIAIIFVISFIGIFVATYGVLAIPEQKAVVSFSRLDRIIASPNVMFPESANIRLAKEFRICTDLTKKTASLKNCKTWADDTCDHGSDCSTKNSQGENYPEKAYYSEIQGFCCPSPGRDCSGILSDSCPGQGGVSLEPASTPTSPLALRGYGTYCTKLVAGNLQVWRKKPWDIAC